MPQPHKDWLHPEKDLVQLSAFKLITITGIIMTIMSSLTIIYHSDLYWDWSYHGFNLFTTIFAVPLGLMTAMITFLGLIALAHRSAQTKQQIALANEQVLISQKQNQFTNHFKNMEEFEVFFKTNGSIHKYNNVRLRSLYATVYPSSKQGELEPCKDYIYKVEFAVQGILNATKALADSSGKSFPAFIRTIHIMNNMLVVLHSTQNVIVSLKRALEDEQKIHWYSESYDAHYLIFQLKHHIEIYHAILEYAGLPPCSKSNFLLGLIFQYPYQISDSGEYLRDFNYLKTQCDTMDSLIAE